MQPKKRKAKKEHTCTLCHKKIEAGTEYMYARVTPWDHSDNEHYSDYKTHIECDKAWLKVGSDYDYYFPDDGRQFLEDAGLVA